MRRSDLISSFTPSNMPSETLEAIFVQREPLARRITTSIRGAVQDGDIEHHIAVGPRGIGKTHLLSLVTFRVLADSDLAEGLAVAWLREEEWGVSSVGELYEQVISRLAADPVNAPEVRHRAGEAANRLEEAAAEELADVAEATIPVVLDGRMLVVVVENLDLLFQDIGTDDQHRLRAFLQNQRNTVLLASTPSLSQSIALRTGLFYGFFAIHHLGELTLDEARQMLVAIANLRADEEGRRLIAYLDTDEAHRRLEVVGRLAGGHPRLWVLMAECITTERLEEIVGLLLAVLDDLTPYYQSQMKALTGQQRKIVMHLSRAEGAVAVKDVAAAVRIQERVAAKQLGDLTRLGYVRRAALPAGVKVTDGRMTLYELREPLLRHVLEVKDARGRPLQLIVDLLRAWFDRPKLEAWSDGPQPLAKQYARAALALPGSVHNDHASIEEVDVLLSSQPDDPALRNDRGLFLLARGRPDEALIEFDRVIALDPTSSVAHFNRGTALADLGRHEDAVLAYDAAIALQPSDAVTHYNRGFSLDELNRLDEAIAAYEAAIALDPSQVSAHFNRGIALDTLGRYEEAIEAFDAAIALDRSDPDLFTGRGVTLAKSGSYEDALDAYKQALDVKPDHAQAHYNRGVSLARLRRDDDAIAAYDTAIALAPDHAEARFNRIFRLINKGVGPTQHEYADALRAALSSDLAEDALVKTMWWLLDAEHIDLTESFQAIAGASSATGCAQAFANALTTVVAENAPLETAWVSRVRAAVHAAEVVGPITGLLDAIGEFQGSGDGAHLLGLPTELRLLAYEALDLTPPDV